MSVNQGRQKDEFRMKKREGMAPRNIQHPTSNNLHPIREQ
jgi:hypothetical protein